MAEVHLNTNSPVYTKILYGGEIVDADGAVQVVIFDITEDPAIIPPISITAPVAILTAEKVETDGGTYKFNIPFNLTTRYREFKVQWSYSVNGYQMSHNTSLDVVTPYCDFAEVIQDLNLGTDPSDPNYKTYHDLVMAEKAARKSIENYTGQKFSLYDDVQVVYGAGSDVLPLPFKLNTLHELYANDILMKDTINNVDNWGYDIQISESGFGLRVNRASMLDNTVYTANGMVPPTVNDTAGGLFTRGSVYRVQGRYGWALVPDDVQIACVELMKDYFSKDTVWRSKYVHSVQSFDWHFEYNTEAYRGTGNVYADQLLLPYVLTQLMVI